MASFALIGNGDRTMIERGVVELVDGVVLVAAETVEDATPLLVVLGVDEGAFKKYIHARNTTIMTAVPEIANCSFVIPICA